MERLTEKRKDGHYNDIDECVSTRCSDKLGLYEDLEEKIEMPLDKFIRIFMEGIWTERFGYIRACKLKIAYYEGGEFSKKVCRIETYVENWWWQYFDLKDYGKTWCLSSEHEEPKKDIKVSPKERKVNIGGI